MTALDDLIRNLQILPGVGPKSAQRMALHLLHNNRNSGISLAAAMQCAMQNVKHCEKCRNYTEQTLCGICRDPQRDLAMLCIVESPADVLALEQAGGFKGTYFVLHGKLSPLDGIGPDELGMQQLETLLDEGNPRELILATNPTVEGEATAHYIAQHFARPDRHISRIAHGVPLGGEIEYTDGGTLAHALQGRREFS